MNTLSTKFNAQAHWIIYILPLWITLLDEIDRRAKERRKKRRSYMQRAFWQASMKESRDRYHRQITCPPRKVPAPCP